MAKTEEEKKAAKREYNRKWRENLPGCNSRNSRKWREAYPERARQIQRNWAKNHPQYTCEKGRKYNYGITSEEQEQLLADQDGVCAICGNNRSKGVLELDHDHVTRQIRGFLCRKCNLGLGHFADNPNWLRRAAGYLERKNKNKQKYLLIISMGCAILRLVNTYRRRQ